MTTVADLITETRRQLTGSNRAVLNRLNGAITSGATTLTVEFTVNFGAGSYLSIDDELFYVWSVDTATKVATVSGAQLGTTAAAHADDAIVEVNPRFPKVRIRQALLDEIRSWGPDVFKVASTTVTASDTYFAQGIDLGITGDWYYILDVRHTTDDSGRYSANWPSVRHYEVLRNAPSAFSSGEAIVINETVPSGTVHVVYAKPFDVSTFDDATDVEATVGLSASMLDIPPLGAVWRLETPNEIRRNQFQAQGESRRAEEVPPGSNLRGGIALKSLRDDRLAEEAARLRALYPMRHG